MSGSMMIAAGIALGAISIALFVLSVIYRRTAGRRIREELKRDYA